MYAVIFRFVPCNGPFDPSIDKHLRNIENENDLLANSIAAASWCKRLDRRAPSQTTATLKVARTNPDVANRLLTGRIRVDDHLVTMHKDIRIPLRCIKCQEYGHTQDACIGVEKCANCTTEFHQTASCDKSPVFVSCRPSSQHPSMSPMCPTFMQKCNALDQRFPKNSMPYFPSTESWTWAAAPGQPSATRHPPPPTAAVKPQAQVNQAGSTEAILPMQREVKIWFPLPCAKLSGPPSRQRLARISVVRPPSPKHGALSRAPPH